MPSFAGKPAKGMEADYPGKVLFKFLPLIIDQFPSTLRSVSWDEQKRTRSHERDVQSRHSEVWV